MAVPCAVNPAWREEFGPRCLTASSPRGQPAPAVASRGPRGFALATYRSVRVAASLFAEIDRQPPVRDNLALAFRCLWRAMLGVELRPDDLLAQPETVPTKMYRYATLVQAGALKFNEEARGAIRRLAAADERIDGAS